MFSVQIFNVLGLTVLSYRPFSISRSNIPSLPVYGVLLTVCAMACYTAFNFPITSYPFLNSNIPSSPTCGFYFTAYTICHGLLLSWMSTDGQGNSYIVHTPPKLCLWGQRYESTISFQIGQKVLVKDKIFKSRASIKAKVSKFTAPKEGSCNVWKESNSLLVDML